MVSEQKYTSAKTSVNKYKLPRIYSKIGFSKGMTVLDYGCGRYIDHIKQKVEEEGCTYYPYDPYNLPNSKLPECKVNYGICSNVLNVIAEDEIIEKVIREVCDKSEKAFFTVYEGDGSGKGRVTGPDSYQRNKKTKWYTRFIKRMGYKHVTEDNKLITVYGGYA